MPLDVVHGAMGRAHPGELSPYGDPAELARSFGDLVPITEDVATNFEGVNEGLGGFFDDVLGGLGKRFDPTQIVSGAVGNLLSGGISTLVGGVVGLFTESPEEAERKRVLQANTTQLARLNSGIARLGTALLGERGGDIAGVRAALGNVRIDASDVRRGRVSDIFERELRRFGLTLEDAERIAAGFGIELDGSVQALSAFAQALETEWLDQILNDFGTGFDIMMQEFRILGTPPEEQFGRVRARMIAELVGGAGGNPATLAANNPVFRGLLGLNEENFEAFAQDFFRRLQAGDETLLDDLGDISIEEFIEFLGFAGDALGDFGDTVGDVTRELRNVPQGFKVALAEFRASDPVVRVPGRTDPDGSRPDVPGTGITITGPVHIHASTYEGGQAAYQGFVDEANHQRRRGGGSGLRVVTR